MTRLIESDPDEDFCVLTATDDIGESVGEAKFRLNGDGSVTLGQIRVEGAHRRNGIGSLMLEAVIAAGRSSGADLLTGEFKPDPDSLKAATMFYKRRGFEIEDNRLYKQIS